MVNLSLNDRSTRGSQYPVSLHRMPKSENHLNPPFLGGIGIGRPFSHIPPSLTDPEFSCTKIQPKFFMNNNVPKFFCTEIHTEFLINDVDPKFFCIENHTEILMGGLMPENFRSAGFGQNF